MKGFGNRNSDIIIRQKIETSTHINKCTFFVCISCVLLLVRLTYGPLTDLPLFYDEAYYHFWSRDLDWGYSSKPPLVAWLIYMTTHLFDTHHEWAVRLASPLLYFATAYFVYASTRFLYSRTTAIYAATIFYTAPFVTFNSLFITAEAPLLFCWSVATYCYLRASHEGRWWAWFGLGCAIGLGLLAKYTMLIWVIGFFIFCIWQKTRYRTLFSRRTFIVVFISSVLVLPNVIWNWQHDFISFQHILQNEDLGQGLFHPNHLLEFIGGQFLVFGPISFYLLLHLMWRPIVTNSAEKLLLCLSFPLLMAMALQALLAKANMNWAAPFYVTASILLARALMLGYKYKLCQWLILSNLSIGGLFYLYPSIQQVLKIEPTETNTPFHRLAGWQQLIQKIPFYIPEAEHQAWLSDSRKLLAYLDFYLPVNRAEQRINIVSFNQHDTVHDQFDLYQPLSSSAFSQFIYMSETPQDLASCFGDVQLLAELNQVVYPSLQRHLYLYRVGKFEGYERCQLSF